MSVKLERRDLSPMLHSQSYDFAWEVVLYITSLFSHAKSRRHRIHEVCSKRQSQLTCPLSCIASDQLNSQEDIFEFWLESLFESNDPSFLNALESESHVPESYLGPIATFHELDGRETANVSDYYGVDSGDQLHGGT